MAGALSGHILEQFYSLKLRSTGPFGAPINPTFNNNNFMTSWPTSSNHNENIVISGAMSFNQNMHGASPPMKLVSDLTEDDPTYMDLSRATSVKIAALQAKLNQQLGPEYISTRPGPGGGPKLVYAEGWKIINLANEVFGFNGWSSSLVNLTTDFVDYNEETRRYSVGVTAIVRVTLRDGVYHEDIGYGLLENSKTKGPALDKCKKEAVTDGLKRALRNFGNLLGNCLYDKAYTNEIVKVKVNPPKFDKSQLHRRPEFAEPKPNVSSTSSASASNTASADSSASATSGTSHAPVNKTTPIIKSEPPLQDINQPSKPLSSVPPHIRKNLADTSSNSTSPLAASTPAGKGNTLSNRGMSTPGAGPSAERSGSAARNAAILNGLSTPITPANHLHPHQAPPQPQQQQGPGPGPGAAGKKVSFSPLAARGGQSAPAVQDDSFNVSVGDGNGGEGGDDSFTFGSDDDAFLATVDLGEGDLGRPIDFEEGLGTGGNTSASGGESSIDRGILGSGSGRQQQSSSVSGAEHVSMGPPQHQTSGQGYRQDVNVTRVVTPAQASGSSSMRQPLQQQQQQRPPTMNSNGNSGGFNGMNASATSTPAPPSRRGGFAFPPEVSGKQGHPQQSRQMQQPSSVIGMKRPMESMRSLSNSNSAQNSRRPMQGMGLMSAGGSSTRQPFGLDLGHHDQESGMEFQSGMDMDGGDMKRVKR